MVYKVKEIIIEDIEAYKEVIANYFGYSTFEEFKVREKSKNCKGTIGEAILNIVNELENKQNLGLNGVKKSDEIQRKIESTCHWCGNVLYFDQAEIHLTARGYGKYIVCEHCGSHNEIKEIDLCNLKVPTGNYLLVAKQGTLNRDYIPKQKIQDKIEELEREFDFYAGREHAEWQDGEFDGEQCDDISQQIKILKELLEEEDTNANN